MSCPELVLEGRQRKHFFAERFIYQLRDTVYEPKSGLPFLKGHPLVESHAVRVEELQHMASRNSYPKSEILGPSTGLSGLPYYHWLLEQLPAALRAQEFQSDVTALYWKHGPSYVKSAADSLFTTALSIDTPILARTYILAGQHRDSGYPHPRDAEILRHATEALRVSPTDLRLLVTRKDLTRSPDNEAAFADLLTEQYGFLVLEPEEVNWSEQVKLFSRANLVVGIHGGALANLVFASPGTRVIEVLPLRRLVTCYANLAHILNLDYDSILLSPTPSNEYGDLLQAMASLQQRLG